MVCTVRGAPQRAAAPGEDLARRPQQYGDLWLACASPCPGGPGLGLPLHCAGLLRQTRQQGNVCRYIKLNNDVKSGMTSKLTTR